MGNWCTKKKAPQITRKKENFQIRSRQQYRHTENWMYSSNHTQHEFQRGQTHKYEILAPGSLTKLQVHHKNQREIANGENIGN